jgi:hypothetical protein
MLTLVIFLMVAAVVVAVLIVGLDYIIHRW